MTLLPEGTRAATAAQYSRDVSNERESISITKPELRAAVDAVDVWVNANKGAFNSALPAAAQAGMTAPQKARLLVAVVSHRFQEGS